MRVALVCALLLAGCATPDAPEPQATPAPCPGHFHITLLVADGDEVLPYFDDGDLDARRPVEGIHMHGDDGVIHIHPPQEACYPLGAALFAVGVHALSRDGGAVQANDEVRNGTVRLDVQPWGEAWQTWDPARMQETVPNAARVLLMANPPTDVAALRDQVPEIPAAYRPA